VDDATQGYYDNLTGTLRGQYPEQKTFTVDQIGHLAVSSWGAKCEELQIKREGAIEAAGATMSDPAARAEAETKFADYYDRQRESLDNQFFAAVDEIYRDNGIVTVPVFSDPQKPLGQRPEFLTDPPKNINGREFRRGPQDPQISGERQSGDDAKTLTPKLEHTPPLHYLQRFAPTPDNTSQPRRSPYFTGPAETYKQHAARAQATEAEHRAPKSPSLTEEKETEIER